MQPPLTNSLRDRIQDYEDRADLKLVPRIPVVIAINGRSFSKTTSLLDKPFNQDFLEVSAGTLIKLVSEIQGAYFGYHYGDQFILICRNDQHTETVPWYNNSVAKISSAASSIATFEFNRLAQNKNLTLLGAPTFTAQAFTLPNSTEIINLLLHYQQDCFQKSLSSAVFYELIKTMDAEHANAILANKNPQEKAQLLFEKTGIEYNSYPIQFKRGIAVYKNPHINTHNEVKLKTILDIELPLFSQSKEWLIDIFKHFHPKN